MITKRIIPQFLLKGNRLFKGKHFQNFQDVGDPVAQAMVYDAQGADELMIVDIEASSEGRMIDPKVITEMITKCRLPIGAGGGISTIDDAGKCFEAGADKIIINTQAFFRRAFISELAKVFGSQSILVAIDVKKDRKGDYEIYIQSGKRKVDVQLERYIREVEDHGAGEIMVTSIDREGTLSGFDCDLYRNITKAVHVPFIASGGAGCYDDIVDLFGISGCDACALGKMLFLRDYDIVRIKSYLKGKKICIREA